MGATTKNRDLSTARTLKDYREQANLAITECINRSEPFTADTVRMVMPDDVTDVHYNVLPALIRKAQRHGRIVRVGSVRSPNHSRKGGWNALWMAAS